MTINPKYLMLLRALCSVMILMLLAACAARQPTDTLAGSTAQKLVTYSIDDLVEALPEDDFSRWSGKRMHVETHFLGNEAARAYADQRLVVALDRRFDIEVVDTPASAESALNVFYTSLGTDRDSLGFFLPIGFMPGFDPAARINLITLERFHGVAEMYYFVGETGIEQRGSVIRARTRTDSLGLPIITLPINNIDRD